MISLLSSLIDVLFCLTVGLLESFVMNNKAFRNLFCNPQKSFHTSTTLPKILQLAVIYLFIFIIYSFL